MFANKNHIRTAQFSNKLRVPQILDAAMNKMAQDAICAITSGGPRIKFGYRSGPDGQEKWKNRTPQKSTKVAAMKAPQNRTSEQIHSLHHVARLRTFTSSCFA